MQTSYAQGKIYKCVEKGKTLYSESPCKENAYNQNVFIAKDERMGNVSPDRETIEATRARIREEMKPNTNSVTTKNGDTITTTTTTIRSPASPSFDKKLICEKEEKKILAIDSAARQPNSPYEQDRLKQRKTEVRQKQSQYKC